jgi:hypothetical protein
LNTFSLSNCPPFFSIFKTHFNFFHIDLHLQDIFFYVSLHSIFIFYLKTFSWFFFFLIRLYFFVFQSLIPHHEISFLFLFSIFVKNNSKKFGFLIIFIIASQSFLLFEWFSLLSFLSYSPSRERIRDKVNSLCGAFLICIALIRFFLNILLNELLKKYKIYFSSFC